MVGMRRDVGERRGVAVVMGMVHRCIAIVVGRGVVQGGVGEGQRY